MIINNNNNNNNVDVLFSGLLYLIMKRVKCKDLINSNTKINAKTTTDNDDMLYNIIYQD